MASERLPTFHPHPSTPKLRLPPGSWDTHCHVLGPTDKYPFAATTTINPADAPKETLFALHAMLGIERCVIVQTATHGMDNRVTEDALAAKGGTYLGVALLPTTVSDAELRRLDGRGFHGSQCRNLCCGGCARAGLSPARLAHTASADRAQRQLL